MGDLLKSFFKEGNFGKSSFYFKLMLLNNFSLNVEESKSRGFLIIVKFGNLSLLKERYGVKGYFLNFYVKVSRIVNFIVIFIDLLELNLVRYLYMRRGSLFVGVSFIIKFFLKMISNFIFLFYVKLLKV